MQIGIDASRAVSEKRTGTEIYSREIIGALLRLAPQHAFKLYVRAGGAVGLADWAAAGEAVELGPNTRWTHAALANEIAQRPPDVLFIPAHVLPARQAIQKTTKTVVTLHDVGYRVFPNTHPFLQRLYLDVSTAFSARFADKIIAVSETTKRDLTKFYRTPAQKIVVGGEGVVSLVEITEQERAQVLQKFSLRHAPFFLHVGSVQPRKNVRRLLMAFAQFTGSCKQPHRPPPLLVLAGGAGWGTEKLPTLAQQLGIAEQVRFVGYINESEKSVLVRSAFAYVCPSLYEGFGLPVLEAHSVSTPVLCSNTSALPEVAGQAALYFDPAHEQFIAAALQRIWLDEPLRQGLIEKSTANAQRFSWDASAQIALNIFEDLCRAR